jgi:hypothetical protein
MKNYKFDDDTWKQIQYHNERIYHNFEFFIKVTLAIAGGLAYLVINKVTGNNELLAYVVRVGALFELLTGLLVSLAIFFHVKSKIARYETPPRKIFIKMWGWLEPYIVLFILLSSIGIFIVAWWKIAGSFLNVGNT